MPTWPTLIYNRYKKTDVFFEIASLNTLGDSPPLRRFMGFSIDFFSKEADSYLMFVLLTANCDWLGKVGHIHVRGRRLGSFWEIEKYGEDLIKNFSHLSAFQSLQKSLSGCKNFLINWRPYIYLQDVSIPASLSR